MTLCIPHNHLIMIIGPSATGKSTLARKILRENPSHSTAIIAADREMSEMILNPNLRLEDRIVKGLANCMVKIDMARHNGMLTIFDMPCPDPTFLTDVLNIMGIAFTNTPITMVKMYPNHDLQLSFARERHQANNADQLFLKQQHKEFAIVAASPLRARHHLILDEYLVTNPYDIELNFM